MNSRYFYLFILLFTLISAGSALAEEAQKSTPASPLPPVIEAELTPPAMPYQRRALLKISVLAPASAKITWPALPPTLGDLSIETIPEARTDAGNGRVSVVGAYQLDPIKPGQYRLPELTVRISIEGKEEGYSLPLVLLNARDLSDKKKAEINSFVESAKPLSLAPHPRYEGYFAAAVAGMAFVSALLFWVLRRKKAPKAAPPRPAWEVAMARLRELQYKNLPLSGKVERFYVDLSAIIRYYLEDRFGLRAPEQTTPEFLEAAASVGVLNQEQQDFLAAFLRHSDRVKFARLEPTMEEMEAQFAAVEAFIAGTVPQANAGSGEAAS